MTPAFLLASLKLQELHAVGVVFQFDESADGDWVSVYPSCADPEMFDSDILGMLDRLFTEAWGAGATAH